jgi:hypothetical protein
LTVEEEEAVEEAEKEAEEEQLMRNESGWESEESLLVDMSSDDELEISNSNNDGMNDDYSGLINRRG